MIIKYRIISGEDENFVRDIEIFSDTTFEDLHLAIQSSCDYDSSLLTTFYLSNKSWDKLDEIVQELIDAESQEDVRLMRETKLDYFQPTVGQRYIYIFDFFSVRAFFIEIVNIREKTKDDENLEFPICTLCHGKPPQQVFIDDINEDELKNSDNFDIFEDDELDDLGFENIDDYDF
ncbi:MAG TPA: hypothetical protein PLL66_09675 [Bacteroidales bacterium]|nr:hypothetical protein [Bacteroidales bacterium]